MSMARLSYSTRGFQGSLPTENRMAESAVNR